MAQCAAARSSRYVALDLAASLATAPVASPDARAVDASGCLAALCRRILALARSSALQPRPGARRGAYARACALPGNSAHFLGPGNPVASVAPAHELPDAGDLPHHRGATVQCIRLLARLLHRPPLCFL